LLGAQTDEFDMAIAELGSISKIRVGLTSAGVWHLGHVTVREDDGEQREWRFEANVTIGTDDPAAEPDSQGFVAFADLYGSRVCTATQDADEYEFEIETGSAPLAGVLISMMPSHSCARHERMRGDAGTSAAVSIELHGQNEAGDESCEAVHWEKHRAHFGTLRILPACAASARAALGNMAQALGPNSPCHKAPTWVASASTKPTDRVLVRAARGAVAKASFTLPSVGHLTMLRVSHDGCWNEGP
jgi:hypothetical protein